MKLADRLMKETLCRKRMTVSVTSTEEMIPAKLISIFAEGTTVPAARAYKADCPGAVGFRVPAQAGFAARGYRLSRAGAAFDGILWLASSILSLDYYWNRVRVQGGAYGAGLQVERNGNIYSSSYRF